MKISINNNINNYLEKSTKDRQRDNYFHFSATNQSFNGVEQVAENLANKMVSKKFFQNGLKSSGFNKFLKSSIENPGMFEALIALGITCTARPATVMVTPGAKKEDKQYAAAQSVASGITGLGFAYAIFDPIKQGLDNILININGKNVEQVFIDFYKDPANKELIKKLVDKKILPDAEKFNEHVGKGNLFGYLKKYIHESGGLAEINDILLEQGKTKADKKAWNELVQEYSDKLKTLFAERRMNGIKEERKYLVHESLEFLKDGSYKLKTSAGADKTKYLFNFTSKIILFPLTAAVMIWSIPKIMRVIFPNHKKSKSKNAVAVEKTPKTPEVSHGMQKRAENFESSSLIKNSAFEKFQKKPAISSKQVSFSGRMSFVTKAYDKVYKKPLANVFTWIFEKVTYSKAYSKKINNLLSDASVKKYAWNVPARDKSGKIMKKADLSSYISNLPNIAAVFGSCLYIFNTIRNKEIDPERKPALCTNMAVVAIFSLLASKGIEKVSTPIFDTFKNAHSKLIGDKLNYDHSEAWTCAKKMLTSTFAFRYLGPVLATPIADKLVKLFYINKNNCPTPASPATNNK